MPGSSSSIAGCNIVLNTVIADELKEFADILENSNDFSSALHELIQKTIKEHKRIIFNGNGYDQAWIEEAKKRGLLNLKTTPDALPYFIKEENRELFKRHHVFDDEEIYSRYEILMEEYVKILNIEALTMVNMSKKEILPAISNYTKQLADTILLKQQVLSTNKSLYEQEILEQTTILLNQAYETTLKLEENLKQAQEIDDFEKQALFYKDNIIIKMNELRVACDKLETLTDEKLWPFPTYGKLLFGIL